MLLRIISAIVIVVIILLILVMIIDCHRFVIREYDFKTSKIDKEIKIIFLSDLHGKSFGISNIKLKEAIRKQKPDLIAVGGDMISAVKKDETGMISDFINDIGTIAPVYYSVGNHELKTEINSSKYGNRYIKYKESLCHNGTVFLENQKADFSENIEMFGLSLPIEFYKKGKRKECESAYIRQLLNIPSAEKLSILLAHNPDYLDAYADWGADLVLSGHYHGGLMRLPGIGGIIGPRLNLFPRFDAGRYVFKDTTMILSCGLGTHTLPIRIFNPGEISVVSIKPEANSHDI